MRRELDALDNKLQWGFEPGRWAKGAAWHDDDWPEPNLLAAGDLAGGFERRDELIAEANDFREVLGRAHLPVPAGARRAASPAEQSQIFQKQEIKL